MKRYSLYAAVWVIAVGLMFGLHWALGAPVFDAEPVAPETVVLSGPRVGAHGAPFTFTATVLPTSTTPALIYVWQADGYGPITHIHAYATDTISYTWDLSGLKRITVTVANAAGAAAASQTILIDPVATLYLPSVLREYPSGLHIDYFRANVEIAAPGDTITLEWATRSAVSVTLQHFLPTGQFGTFWAVEPTGDMTYTIPTTWRNFEHFGLYARDAAGLAAWAYLNIPLTCPDTWFFEPAPEGCPAAPALYSAGAAQPFEHGVMLWVQEEDRIYVLWEAVGVLRWRAYTDEWDEGEPESDPTLIPPAGMYQPLRGFGLVWRQNVDVRAALGWATAGETGYGSAVQRTSRWKYNDVYIRALDGGVWRLLPEGSGWEYIPAP